MEEARTHHSELLNTLEEYKTQLEDAKETLRLAEEKALSGEADDEEEAISAQEEVTKIRRQRLEVLKAFEQSKQSIEQAENQLAIEKARIEEEEKERAKASVVAPEIISDNSDIASLEQSYLKLAQTLKLESNRQVKDYDAIRSLEDSEATALQTFIEKKFERIKSDHKSYLEALKNERNITLEQHKMKSNEGDFDETDRLSRMRSIISKMIKTTEKNLEQQERLLEQQKEQQERLTEQQEKLIAKQEFEKSIPQEFAYTTTEGIESYSNRIRQKTQEIRNQLQQATQTNSKRDIARLSAYKEVFEDFSFSAIENASKIEKERRSENKKTTTSSSESKTDSKSKASINPVVEEQSKAVPAPTFPDVSFLDERTRELAKRLKAFDVGYSGTKSDIAAKYDALFARGDSALRAESLKVHPDKGGAVEKFQALDDARKAIKAERDNPGYWYKAGQGVEPENREIAGSLNSSRFMSFEDIFGGLGRR